MSTEREKWEKVAEAAIRITYREKTRHPLIKAIADAIEKAVAEERAKHRCGSAQKHVQKGKSEPFRPRDRTLQDRPHAAVHSMVFFDRHQCQLCGLRLHNPIHIHQADSAPDNRV